MDWLTILLIATILVVVLFDFTNGFHDASNIVATVIASRAMSLTASKSRKNLARYLRQTCLTRILGLLASRGRIEVL